MDLVIEDFQQGYINVVKHVLEEGEPASPRGQATREVLGGSFTLLDPTRCLPVGTGRGIARGVAAVEALQLIGGFSSPELVQRVAPVMSRYADDGYFHGAYGPRLRPQYEKLVQRLRCESDTRRAVVTIWDPLHDLHVDDAADFPCTVALAFNLRQNRLHLHTFMRSNDVWLGTAYDVFQFCQLQCTVANVLGVGLGRYRHTAASLHLYESNIDRVEQLNAVYDDYPYWCGVSGGSWAQASRLARDLAHGREDGFTLTERWLTDAVRRVTV